MKRKSMKRQRRRKNDGTKRPNILYFDDFAPNIQYFDDISFRRTINFFTRHKDSGIYLSKLASSLFLADNNDNSVLYFQKKTIIGFMIISGYFNEFWNFFNHMLKIKDIDDIDDIPNKWSSTVVLPKFTTYVNIYNDVKKFVNENIKISDITRIYKEYFCLNYRTMKTKDITGIKCEDKKPIVEKQIYEEILIKITYIIYLCIHVKDRSSIKYILNHYILSFYKSDRATEYDISLELKNKSYSDDLMTLYNKFNNTDVNNIFVILKYLYQYNYKGGKQFSTCGETTLLNIFNYCLINDNGTFNTEKILNEDVVKFYKGKTMSQIADKGGRKIMNEWLDIVSNLKLTNVYNSTGDIHNNVLNVACVLNKLVYDKETYDIEEPHEFIIDTIKYISNNSRIRIEIEKDTKDSISLNIDNKYSLFFRPGHGEMNQLVNDTYTRKRIPIIDLNDMYADYDVKLNDFDIVHTVFRNILTARSDDFEKLDYDEALSRILIVYFIRQIEYSKVNELLLLEIKRLYIDYDEIEKLEDFDKTIVVNFLKKIINTESVSIYCDDDKYEIVNLIIEKLPKNVNRFVLSTTEYDKDEIVDNFNLKPLEKLNLETLILENVNMLYINLPLLKSLDVTNGHTENIKKYKKLENVHIVIDNSFDMNSLSELVNLKKIDFNCIKIEEFDCKYLQNCVNLEKLNLISLDSDYMMYLKNIHIISKYKITYCMLLGFIITDDILDVIFNNFENVSINNVLNEIIQKKVLILHKNVSKESIETLKKCKIRFSFDKDDVSDYTILLKYVSELLSETLFRFSVSKNTKMEKILKKFEEQYGGTGYKFFINNKKVKETDTIKDFDISGNKIEMIVTDEENPSPKSSSPKRTSPKGSSPKRTSSSKKSPKTSSPKSSSSRKSPKTLSSRKSPKSSTTRKSFM